MGGGRGRVTALFPRLPHLGPVPAGRRPREEAEGWKRKALGARRAGPVRAEVFSSLRVEPRPRLHEPQVAGAAHSQMKAGGALGARVPKAGSEQGAAAATGLHGHQQHPQLAR